MQGRTQKSFYNVITGVFGQILSFILSFAIRTVFIKVLGETYLGLNGLYSNILSVLGLAEMGFGTAIVVELYRTEAQKDREKTQQYLFLYKKAYYIVGSVIFLLGLFLVPFLEYFVNDIESLEGINYRLIFVLYLINTSFSYFFFAYRESILQANQKEYKARIITYIFKVIEMLLQIVTLFIFESIYLYLVIPIVLNCISIVVKGILIGKWFPYIKQKPKGKLSRQELKNTTKNIGAVAIYQVSNCVIGSTDNIVLSSYVSVIITGLYSNYLIIVSAVKTIVDKIFYAFTASLGNLNVEAGENLEKKYKIFNILSFMNFWFYGFCATCMFTLFTPFIKIWIGDRFVMNTTTEAMIILNFLVVGLQETVSSHRAAYGLFYKGRYRPFFSVSANIILSILFVNILPSEYGVVAVLLGTVLSNLCISWWYDAYIVHKYAFRISPKNYYIKYWIRMLFCVTMCLLLKVLCGLIYINSYANIIVYLVLCILIYNSIFFLLFGRGEEARYLIDSLSFLIKKIRRKR